MSINPESQYPGKIAPSSADYPYGEARNITTPSDGTGTPWEAALVNDLFGFQQALLSAAGIVPTGNPDSVSESQYMQALVEIASGRAFTYDDTGATNAYALDVQNNQYQIGSLFDGLRAGFRTSNSNTAGVTVNLAGLGAKTLVDVNGDALTGGEVLTTSVNEIVYDITNDRFTLVSTASGSTPPVTPPFYPKNYIDGLELANSSGDADHDIDIIPGECVDSNGDVLLVLPSATTKRLDSVYSFGSGNGGRFAGSLAADAWYHVFIIKRDSDDAIDVGFDTSPTAANIPAGFTDYNWIGAIKTDGSLNILGFTQAGNEFLWKEPIGSFNTTDPGTAAILQEVDVPTDITVSANLTFNLLLTAASALDSILLATSPLQDDIIPSSSVLTIRAYGPNNDIESDSSAVNILTDNLARVRYRVTQSDSTLRVRCTTQGWTGPRAGSIGAAGSTGSAITSVTQLDDYEEGTWTPTIAFSASNGDLNIVYDRQTGYYTKVGRLVSLNMYLRTTTFTHSTGTGAVVIEGIPFDAISGTRHVGALCWGGITFDSPFTFAILNMNDAGTRITLDKSGQTTDLTNVFVNEVPSGTNQNYRGSIVYHEV